MQSINVCQGRQLRYYKQNLKTCKLINFKLIFPAFRSEICLKVLKCFIQIEIKCFIINHKKNVGQARETTYVGSEKMGKCGKTGNFTCDFVAFNNINLKR